MTERQQLFTDIAEGFDAQEGDGGYTFGRGICFAIDTLAPPSSTAWGLRAYDTFSLWLDDDDEALRDYHWWPLTAEGDDQRVLFALFMAAMSDEDFYAVEDDHDHD